MVENDIEKLSKIIVLNCFRNTHLENIHAGKKNGGVGYGFGDEDMKKLMIESVNKTYTLLLHFLGNRKLKQSTIGWIKMTYPYDWNKAEIENNL